MNLPRARGRALTLIALDRFNMHRHGLLERLPWLGDWLFRRRLNFALTRRR